MYIYINLGERRRSSFRLTRQDGLDKSSVNCFFLFFWRDKKKDRDDIFLISLKMIDDKVGLSENSIFFGLKYVLLLDGFSLFEKQNILTNIWSIRNLNHVNLSRIAEVRRILVLKRLNSLANLLYHLVWSKIDFLIFSYYYNCALT